MGVFPLCWEMFSIYGKCSSAESQYLAAVLRAQTWRDPTPALLLSSPNVLEKFLSLRVNSSTYPRGYFLKM